MVNVRASIRRGVARVKSNVRAKATKVRQRIVSVKARAIPRPTRVTTPTRSPRALPTPARKGTRIVVDKIRRTSIKPRQTTVTIRPRAKVTTSSRIVSIKTKPTRRGIPIRTTLKPSPENPISFKGDTVRVRIRRRPRANREQILRLARDKARILKVERLRRARLKRRKKKKWVMVVEV